MDSTMQTARRVRWGVLSLANIAVKAVIPAIQASRNGELTAVASRQLTRAERFAAESAGGRAFGSYEALLDDPDVEAVYIPLPNGLHAAWTLAGMRSSWGGRSWVGRRRRAPLVSTCPLAGRWSAPSPPCWSSAAAVWV